MNPAPAVPPKSSSNFSLSACAEQERTWKRRLFSLRFLKAVSVAASSGGSPVSLQPVSKAGTPTEAPDFWLVEWPTGLCPLPALWPHRPRRHSKSPHGCMSTCARTPMTRHRPVQMPDLMWPPGLQLLLSCSNMHLPRLVVVVRAESTNPYGTAVLYPYRTVNEPRTPSPKPESC